MFESLVEPQLVWGLVARGVGLMYVVAFGSLAGQIERQIGSRGIAPVAARLARARSDFPGLRRFIDYPTVLWLSSSDRAIRAIPWLGILCGACAIYGGPWLGWLGLALGWLLWLSLESAYLVFPWDTMLQELGFLALFLPGTQSLPSWLASDLPFPAVAFMFRWLTLRLMWGFAKVKFVGATKRDILFLRGFFVWLPLPTPLAWLAHRAPRWLLIGMLYFMFVAEVIAPGLGFFAGLPRLISFALLVALMVGIHLTGNWGFFNIGYALLCVCLLDTQSSLLDLGREPWASALWQWPQVAVNACMLLMFLTGLVYLLVSDSWITRTWMHWQFDEYTLSRRWARALVSYFRALAPLRLVNGYGVFPPHALAPMRQIPVFEGSDDGKVWKAYGYRYMPTEPGDRPPFVAPHHPRFDMSMYYATFAVHDGSFFASIIGDGTPYAAWCRCSWLERVAERLAQGEPLVTAAFKRNPFPEAPPKFVRVSAVVMTPTSLETLRETGHWWHVRRTGTLVPARTKQSWIFETVFPEPELFHPDWVNFRRRSKALQTIGQAFSAGVPPDRAVLQDSDLTATEVSRFWQEFVPLLAQDREDFAHHREKAAELRQRFGAMQLHRFERILERFCWLLRLRTERFQFGDGEPKIPLNSSFRYHMLLHAIVLDGREAYLAMLEDPSRAAARAERASKAEEVRALSVLRSDALLNHLCAFRWFTMALDLHEVNTPGLWEYYPLFSEHVPLEEDFRPVSVLQADGEHVVAGFYPPLAQLADEARERGAAPERPDALASRRSADVGVSEHRVS